MKKIFSILTISVFLLCGSMAFAQPDYPGQGFNPGNGNYVNTIGNAFWKQGNGSNECGPSCYAVGTFDLNLSAMDGAIGGGLDGTYKGLTGGGALAGGATFGHMEANVNDGSAFGQMGISGGGIISGNSFDFFEWDNGPRHILGSWSEAQAETTAFALMDVDPDMGWRARADGNAEFFGIAGQATGDFSVMGPAPIFENDGYTGALAAQGSLGYIEGGLFVGAGSDYWFFGYRDQYAGGMIDAGVVQNGFSQAHSWRGVENNGPYRTEYLGSRSIAETHVTSWGHHYDYDGAGIFSDYSHSYVDGGFIAAGIGANKSVIETQNGIGTATVKGGYLGIGDLNCNYDGYLNVKTNVSSTTLNAPNSQGSIVRSYGEGTLTSTMYSGGQIVD